MMDERPTVSPAVNHDAFQTELDHLRQQITRIDRVNLLWRRGLGLLVIALAIVLVGSTQHTDDTKILRAEKFVLGGATGEPATLFMDHNGQPVFSLNDSHGKSRLALTLTQDGRPRISLRDKDGKRTILMDEGTDGSPALTLFDQREKCRLVLLLKRDGSPYISLFDKNSQVRMTSSVQSNGDSHLYIMNSKDSIAMSIGISENDVESGMTYYDNDGKDRLSMSVMNREPSWSSIRLSDQSGLMRILQYAGRNGSPYTAYFDQNEKPRMTIGNNDGLYRTEKGKFKMRFFDIAGKITHAVPDN
ncbi:MAG: hypothetical protein ABI353_14650 [Isosphaeraceae bacterium]